MDDFERLRRSIAGCIAIAHHLRGRIRLKLTAQAEGLPAPSAADLQRFQALLGSVDGVRSLQVNVLARSCTIEYDTAILPFEAWPDFLEGVASPAAAVLEAALRRKYQEARAE